MKKRLLPCWKKLSRKKRKLTRDSLRSLKRSMWKLPRARKAKKAKKTKANGTKRRLRRRTSNRAPRQQKRAKLGRRGHKSPDADQCGIRRQAFVEAIRKHGQFDEFQAALFRAIMHAKIVIADDSASMRLAVRSLLLRVRPDWEICGEACDGE